jgi:hypothetical protein
MGIIHQIIGSFDFCPTDLMTSLGPAIAVFHIAANAFQLPNLYQYFFYTLMISIFGNILDHLDRYSLIIGEIDDMWKALVGDA